jgi:hypothetical protein
MAAANSPITPILASLINTDFSPVERFATKGTASACKEQ